MDCDCIRNRTRLTNTFTLLGMYPREKKVKQRFIASRKKGKMVMASVQSPKRVERRSRRNMGK